MKMKTPHKALGALALGLAVAAPASAVELDFGGYVRSGAGSSSEGGKEVCFRLPGSVVFFRLGNECDTYFDLGFKAKLAEVDGTSFHSKFTISYGTQQAANWEQTTPSVREAFVEARDIGAGLSVPALKGAALWVGKRFYKNPDVHMLDYTYWEPAQGPGFGLDKVDVGIGSFSYALLRIGDFTGYGINTDLGGFNPDLIGGGSRTATVHDFRIADIPTNTDGSITAGFDIVRANNRDGTSTYTDANGNPVTINNEDGKNGFGLTVSHMQKGFLGLGGMHNLVFQYARNAASLKGFGFAGSTDERKEWMLFNHFTMEPSGAPFTMSATAGVRNAKINDSKVREYWIGARPQYHLNNIMSLMSEVGYQQVKVDDGASRKLAKLTLGTQFSAGRSIWSRPTLRFYATYAKWNKAASDAGPVVCTGRDCARAVDAYDGKTNGLSYGAQVETWF